MGKLNDKFDSLNLYALDALKWVIIQSVRNAEVIVPLLYWAFLGTILWMVRGNPVTVVVTLMIAWFVTVFAHAIYRCFHENGRGGETLPGDTRGIPRPLHGTYVQREESSSPIPGSEDR